MPNLAIVHDDHQYRLETKLKRELGEQLLALLNDEYAEDILLNPDGSLWAKRIAEGFKRVGEMGAAQASSALNTIAAWRDPFLNHDHPILEAELPIDGSRFEGIVPPVARRPVFAIRWCPPDCPGAAHMLFSSAESRARRSISRFEKRMMLNSG
jgi:type IV secretion system protein VirB11